MALAGSFLRLCRTVQPTAQVLSKQFGFVLRDNVFDNTWRDFEIVHRGGSLFPQPLFGSFRGR